MISIIDYGLGNTNAFLNIYKKLNIPARLVSNNTELKSAKKIILPGVGSFDWAMTKLNDSGMRETLDQMICEKGIPVMGICVGMQMMAKSSDEGKLDGLGWIDAEVKKFDVPHMGWNKVLPVKKHSLFFGLDDQPEFYFLHSYYLNKVNDLQIIAQTDYMGLFTSSFCHNNIIGVQFHPEKSHKQGIRLLNNFAKIETF